LLDSLLQEINVRIKKLFGTRYTRDT